MNRERGSKEIPGGRPPNFKWEHRIMGKQNHLSGLTLWQKSKELHDCSMILAELPELTGRERRPLEGENSKLGGCH